MSLLSPSRRARRQLARRQRRTQLRVESLEARRLLAILTVTNTDDSGSGSLRQAIIAANDLFKDTDFLLSEELTLVDCTLAPLFWRLPAYGVKLGKSGAAVQAYIQRLISRKSFKASLTTAERELILNAS